MGIQFDWSISIGNILSAAIVIGGWFYAFFQLKSDVRIVRHDMKNVMLRQEFLGDSFNQISTVLQTIAVQDEKFKSVHHRLDTIDDDIRDIQRGEGFKKEVSGEYTRHGKVKS